MPGCSRLQTPGDGAPPYMRIRCASSSLQKVTLRGTSDATTPAPFGEHGQVIVNGRPRMAVCRGSSIGFEDGATACQCPLQGQHDLSAIIC